MGGRDARQRLVEGLFVAQLNQWLTLCSMKGATLVVARAGIVHGVQDGTGQSPVPAMHEFQTGRDKPVPYKRPITLPGSTGEPFRRISKCRRRSTAPAPSMAASLAPDARSFPSATTGSALRL